MPQSGEHNPYSVLYKGESPTAFSTSFPVSSAAEANRRGDEAARAHDYDRALFEYIRGLKLQKDKPSADTLYKIGAIHDSRGNYHLAELAYRWALKVDPQHESAETGLGILLVRKRRYGAAEHLLKRAVEQDPTTWRAQNALGVLSDLNGDYEQSERYYRSALAARPGSARILNNLGYSKYLAGDWTGAQRALERALEQNPNYTLAWRNLGLVYVREGRFQKALQALARTTDTAMAYNDVGYIEMLDGKYAKAVHFFNEAMRLSPSFYVVASQNAKHAEQMLTQSVADPKDN